MIFPSAELMVVSTLSSVMVSAGGRVSKACVYWAGAVAWLPAASVMPLVLTSMVMSPSVNVVGVATRV